jgi:hypothetical protein
MNQVALKSLIVSSLLVVDVDAASLLPYMPRAEDFTLMCWKNGPQSYLGAKTSPPQPVLCMQSGTIGLAIDTKTLRILRAGKFSKAMNIQNALQDGNEAISALPPLAFELRVLAAQKTFVCQGRPEMPKDEFYFPVRFIESGRFLQRVAIEGLEFADAAGRSLGVQGRLELALWPDRLVLSFGLEKYPLEGELELFIRAGQKQVSIPAVAHQPAVLELFKASNTAEPVIEALSGLELKRSAEAGCTMLRIPMLTWKNSSGTYYPEEELDRLDRWRFRVKNESSSECFAPIMFVDEHPPAITGFTPSLCDTDGVPTGIPIQISKNWHRRRDKGQLPHEGSWFHGCTVIRIPARSQREFLLQINYARYGGVPAASHAQLCLVGWGHNQFWEQAAIGSFGESICYEPGRVQRRCFIDDVRPLMTLSAPNEKRFGWAGNCGGGDFLMWIDEKGQYQGFRNTKTDYRAYGPCLTDVCYAEQTSGAEIDSRVNASIIRSDDYLRAFHRLRYDVRKPVKWERLAFYQLGADYYNATPARRVAIGDVNGAVEEWEPAVGKDVYDRTCVPLTGESPWISVHGVERAGIGQGEAFASRGLIVRSWKAVLGGKPCARPHASFYSTEWGKGNFRTTVELSPPPGISLLKTGDFVDALVELVVFPSDPQTYYGPNESFRSALEKDADTWRLVQREASRNRMRTEIYNGDLRQQQSTTVVDVDWRGRATLTLTDGLGYFPITFAGMKSHRDFELSIDGKVFNQAIHGNDFWQTDYDELRREWRVTYNILRDGQGPIRLEFRRVEGSFFAR